MSDRRYIHIIFTLVTLALSGLLVSLTLFGLQDLGRPFGLVISLIVTALITLGLPGLALWLLRDRGPSLTYVRALTIISVTTLILCWAWAAIIIL